MTFALVAKQVIISLIGREMAVEFYPEAVRDMELANPGRGGSWYDFPKLSTSAARLPHPTFQRADHVGFRVLVED